MTMGMPFEIAEPIVKFRDHVISLLDVGAGPILIQAGHFMVSCDLKTGAVWPCVYEEMIDEKSGLSHRDSVRGAIGIFPSVSWLCGLDLATAVARQNGLAQVVTVVNDWQLIPKSWPGGAEEARRAFYANYSAPLDTYRVRLESLGLSTSILARLGKHSGFISENWLRRRLERHIRNMRRLHLPGSERLYEEICGDHACIRFADSEDESRTMLFEGATNCAGEIVELVHMTNIGGFKTLVNFYPLACQNPVNEGTRVGLRLFELGELVVINVGFSCSGERSAFELLERGMRISILSREKERSMKWDPR
jgi:hypothetical protein